MRTRWGGARSSGGPAGAAGICGIACTLAFGGALHAQDPPPRLDSGTVVEELISPSDGTHRHAIYLPSSYDRARRWPVVFLMDPRGRALLPLERFRPAAEALGYVLVSSYDTRSDVDDDVMTPAMTAMLEDAQRLVEVDARRLYLVGFSGTARSAWRFSTALRENLAGLVSVGAGLSASMPEWTLPLLWDGPFAVVGSAGRLDFNFEEMRRLDRALDRTRLPHRFEYFDGPHGWMPEAIARRSLVWLELQAMRSGLRTLDTALVRSFQRAEADRAERLARDGLPLESFETLASLVATLEGVVDVAPLEARLRHLDASLLVHEARWIRERHAAEARERAQRLAEVVEGVLESDRTGHPTPPTSRGGSR